MKYMLLIYGAENCWTDAEREACMVESLAICDELAARGQFLDASPLQSVTTAATGATPYLLLCHDDEAAWRAAGPDALRAAMTEATALCRELDDAGAYLSAAPLHTSDTATCVRVRDGKRVVTDGPFAETREVLGGYYLILAESSDAAVRLAALHPGAPVGSVEVRPVFDLTALRNAK